MLSLAAPGNQAMGSSTHVQNKSSEDSSKHSIIVMVSFYIKNNLIFKILPKKQCTLGDLLVSPLEHYSLRKTQLRFWVTNLTSDPVVQKT